MNATSMISVIIPVYNASEYLHECINSLINQTYKNIEIIAVNDGSRDNSLEILESYRNNIPHLKIVDQENKGASEARRIGLHFAEGKYIVFLDADDWLEVTALEKMHKQCEMHDIDFLETTFTYYSSEIQKRQSYHRHTGFFDGKGLLNIVLDVNCGLAITSAMSKRSIWSDDVFLPADKRLPNEDIFPWFTIWKRIKKAEIRNDMPYYYYRFNPNSATNSGIILKHQTLWKEYFIEVRKRLSEQNILNIYESQLRIIEIDRLVFNVKEYDTSDSWFKSVLNYDTTSWGLKHKIAAKLLRSPYFCNIIIRFNRKVKNILFYIKNNIQYLKENV